MKNQFCSPKAAVIYEDKKVYIAFAKKPMAKGHIIVFWKRDVPDLHALSRKDYDYLMDVVDVMRSAMLHVFHTSKVYLFYLDEIGHVHWHLLPRLKEKGFSILLNAYRTTADFRTAPKLQESFRAIRSEF